MERVRCEAKAPRGRENGMSEIGGASHGERCYESIHKFHGRKPYLYGEKWLCLHAFDGIFHRRCWSVPCNRFFTLIEIIQLPWKFFDFDGC